MNHSAFLLKKNSHNWETVELAHALTSLLDKYSIVQQYFNAVWVYFSSICSTNLCLCQRCKSPSKYIELRITYMYVCRMVCLCPFFKNLEGAPLDFLSFASFYLC